MGLYEMEREFNARHVTPRELRVSRYRMTCIMRVLRRENKKSDGQAMSIDR